LTFKQLSLALVAGVLILLAAVFVPGTSPEPQRVSPTAAGPSDNLMQWRVGTSQSYRLTMESKFSMGLAQGKALPIELSLNGLLNFQTLEVNQFQSLVGLQFTEIDLKISGSSNAQTNRDLRRAFRVRFTRAGVPSAFEFTAQLPEESREILRNVVAVFQTSLQAGGDWKATEHYAGRDYEAHYSVTSPGTIKKTKLRFVNSNGSTQYQNTDTVISDEIIQIAVNTDWLTSMKLTETIESKAANKTLAVSHSRAEIELLSSRQASPSSVWAFTASRKATEKASTMVLSLREARVRLKKGVVGLGGLATERPQYVSALSELVRGSPELVADISEQLKGDVLADRVKADLFLVLELAGSDQAQSALSALAADPGLDEMGNLRAIVALAGVEVPNMSTVDALWNIAYSGLAYSGDARPDTAVLALGSMAASLKVAQDEDAGITDQLLSGAFSSANEDRRSAYLLALGNTGDASLQPQLLPLLDDPSDKIRRQTAAQFERFGSNQVGNELAERFYTEPSGEVRGAIAGALVAWDSPTAEANMAVAAAISSESNEKARYSMTRFLAAHVGEFPENEATLRRLAQSDQSSRIRREVAAMVFANKK